MGIKDIPEVIVAAAVTLPLILLIGATTVTNAQAYTKVIQEMTRRSCILRDNSFRDKEEND